MLKQNINNTIQTITLQNQTIPINMATTQTKQPTQLIGVQGIIQIRKNQQDNRTLRTILTQNKQQIIQTYNNMTKKAILNRTKEQYQEICQKYIEQYTKQLQITPNKIRHTPMLLTYLGKAYVNNTMTLNTLMQYMTEPLIENIIYHELCHLYTLKHNGYMKHDKPFYDILYQRYTKEENKQITTN